MEIALKFVRTRSDAIPPQRAHSTDAGFDIYAMEKVSENGNILKYDTGLAVSCPPGFFLQLVARSSLHKEGYMLANGVGVIDSDYRGNVGVILCKIRDDASELKLPCKIAQLIPIPIFQGSFEEVEKLDETERGTGGFGSTGN